MILVKVLLKCSKIFFVCLLKRCCWNYSAARWDVINTEIKLLSLCCYQKYGPHEPWLILNITGISSEKDTKFRIYFWLMSFKRASFVFNLDIFLARCEFSDIAWNDEKYSSGLPNDHLQGNLRKYIIEKVSWCLDISFLSTRSTFGVF